MYVYNISTAAGGGRRVFSTRAVSRPTSSSFDVASNYIRNYETNERRRRLTFISSGGFNNRQPPSHPVPLTIVPTPPSPGTRVCSRTRGHPERTPAAAVTLVGVHHSSLLCGAHSRRVCECVPCVCVWLCERVCVCTVRVCAFACAYVVGCRHAHKYCIAYILFGSAAAPVVLCKCYTHTRTNKKLYYTHTH